MFVQWRQWPRTPIYCILCVCTVEAVAAGSYLLHYVCLYSGGSGRGLSFLAFCLFIIIICCILCVCTAEAVAADSHFLHFVCLLLLFVAFCVFVQRRQWPRTLICCILCISTVEAVAANYLQLYSLCLYSGGSGRGLPFIALCVFLQWRQWPRPQIGCILCVCTVEAVAAASDWLHSVCLYSGGSGHALPFVAFCVFVQWMQWPRTLICCILCVCTVEAVAADSHLLHSVCLYSGGSGRGLPFIALCVFVQWRLWPQTLICCICVFVQWRQWPRTLICCILCVCTVKAVTADSHLLHSVCLCSGGSGRVLSFVGFCVFVQWRQWLQTPIYCILCVRIVEAVAADVHLLHFVCFYSGGCGRGLLFVAFCVFVQRRQWPRTLICCILCVCTVEAVATHSHLLHFVCLYSGCCGRGLSFIAFCVFVQWRLWPWTLICCILCVCTVEAVATHSHLLHFVCLYSGCCGRGLSFAAFCVFVQWRLWPRTLIYCILCVCTVEAVAADSHLLHYVCLYSGGSGRGLLFVAFCVFVQWRQWPRTLISCILSVYYYLLHFVCLYSGGSGRRLPFIALCVFFTVEAVAAASDWLHSVCLYSGGSGHALSFLAFCLFIIICCILCVCTVEAVAADSHLLHYVCFYSGGSGRGLRFVAFCVFVQWRLWPRTLICCILCVCTVEAVAADSHLLHYVCLYSGGCGRKLLFVVFCVFVQWRQWPRTPIYCIMCVCTVEAVATHSHLLHSVCLYSEGCDRGLSFVAFCVFVQWRQWPRTLICWILCVCAVEAVAADSHLLHFVCSYSGGSGRGRSFVAFCVFLQWRLWPRTILSCILCVCTVEAVAADSHLLFSLCLYSGGSGRKLLFVVFCVFVQWRQWPRTLICCILCVFTVEAVAADSYLLHSVCLYSGGSGRGLSFVAFCVFVQWRQWPRTLICCILCVCTVDAVAADSHLLLFVCLYSGGCGHGLLFVAFCVFVQWMLWPRTLFCCILCVCTVEAVAADSHLLHFVCLYSGGSGRGLPFIALCVFVQWRQWPRTLICCILCVCTVEAVATHSHFLHFVCLLLFVAFCVFVQWRQWPRTLICCILCVCTVEAVAADSHLLHSVYFYSGGCGRELS